MDKLEDTYQFGNILKVIGVGSGGNNAVNHMYLQDIDGVTFVISDTDKHRLDELSVPNCLLLGVNTTLGQSACSDPEAARRAAEESESEIAAFFDGDTKMVIIVAGLGGETGTDVAPFVARVARDKEVALTVGIVTIPFLFEGSDRIQMAHAGINEMSKYVDALFIVDNQRLTEIYGDFDPSNAFIKADETLATTVGSLCNLVSADFKVCFDFNDVYTTLHKGGQAMVFSGYAVGEHRVTKALEDAFESPLLKDCDIYCSKKIMLTFLHNPDSGSPVYMEEMNEVQEFMYNFDQETDVIWGMAHDKTLKDKLKVIVLASGFNVSYNSQIPLQENLPSKKD